MVHIGFTLQTIAFLIALIYFVHYDQVYWAIFIAFYLVYRENVGNDDDEKDQKPVSADNPGS